MNETSNIKLNCRVSGIGHPVVFLHGFLESMSMWNYLDFNEEFTQILFDLPGHGESSYDEKSVSSMRSIAELIKVELNERSIEAYHVVGHSMGGYVGLELMKMDRNCLGLILVNSNFLADDLQKRKNRKRLAEVVRANKAVFLYEAIPNLFFNPEKYHLEIKRLIEEAKNISAELMVALSLSMSLRLDNSKFVHENLKKILIIQGAEDHLNTFEIKLKENEIFRDSTLELADCGHMAHIECSSLTVTAIQKFLQKKTETFSFRCH